MLGETPQVVTSYSHAAGIVCAYTTAILSETWHISQERKKERRSKEMIGATARALKLASFYSFWLRSVHNMDEVLKLYHEYANEEPALVCNSYFSLI